MTWSLLFLSSAIKQYRILTDVIDHHFLSPIGKRMAKKFGFEDLADLSRLQLIYGCLIGMLYFVIIPAVNSIC